ncbi:MAG: 30S ribosomal protein S5 [Fimbriimonadales bacterium]|nr:30S ribosomal protein S5 [Fimbriimonadales bacterium]
MRRQSAPQRREDDSGLDVRVVQTNKVSKTHKGGKTMSWSVLVIVGDGKGKVGAGMGKARGIPDAIRKGEEAAKRAMFSVPMNGHTIPHQVLGTEGATKVLLRPASPGTGVVAGGSVRQILEAAGLHDVLAKTLGSRNAVNCAWAAVDALKQLVQPKDRASQRGMELKEIAPWFAKAPLEEQEVEVASEVG